MRYQYDIRNIEEQELLIEKLNEWGNDGWELVSIIERKHNQYDKIEGLDLNYVVRVKLFNQCIIKKELTNQ